MQNHQGKPGLTFIHSIYAKLMAAGTYESPCSPWINGDHIYSIFLYLVPFWVNLRWKLKLNWKWVSLKERGWDRNELSPLQRAQGDTALLCLPSSLMHTGHWPMTVSRYRFKRRQRTQRKRDAGGESRGGGGEEMKKQWGGQGAISFLKLIHNSFTFLSFLPLHFLFLLDGGMAGGMIIYKGD